MHLRDPEQLGDEPLYCEVDHESVLYSGSEDDYYEAPETRRLRIEAKAVQFLNGNVPYLLSARLEGPFDRQSWTNPWRSKRRERQLDSGRASGQRTVQTAEAARADVNDKAIDDLPDTQKTNLYPLPSPDTTNPPSVRKNPYLDDSEYNRINEWRDKAEGSPTAADPFCSSHYNACSNASSVKKRPASKEWLHREEPKKRKSMQVMTSPAESPSRAAAQKRSKRTHRHLSVSTQSAPRSSTYGDNVVATRGAVTPDLSKIGSLLNAKPVSDEKPESSEDELSTPSTTPSGRAARSSAGKLSSRDFSPSRRRKQTKQAKMLTSQDAEEGADEPMAHRSKTTQEALKATKISRDRAVGHSQQDSSFCFHHVKTKSPAKEVQHLYADNDDPNAPSAGFASSQQLDAGVLATLAVHKRHNAHPAGELEHKDTPELDRMAVDAHNPMRSLPNSGNNSGVLDQSDDRKGTESENIHRIEPKTNYVSIHSGCEARTPEQLSKEVRNTNQSSPKADADWSTYINTQDLSDVTAKPLQENKDHNGIAFMVQGEDGESEGDSDWATVTTTQDILMFDPAIGEGAEINGNLPVVEQGFGDMSDPEWSTFLNTPDRSATSYYQFESSVLRRGTLDGVIEYPSDSDWSTCMSVSSQCDVDQTGNTSHGPPSADTTAPEEVSSQDYPTSIILSHPQDLEAGSGTQNIPPTGIFPTIVVGAMAVEGNTKSADVSPATVIGSDPLALMGRPASKLEQGMDGSAKADQNLERSVTSTGIAAATTADEIRIENRAALRGEMVVELKTPREETNTLSTGNFTIVDTTANNAKSQQLQSPWSKDGAIGTLPKAPPVDYSRIASERQASPEPLQKQSPWSKEHMETPMPKFQASQYDEATGDGRSPELSLLAERALAFASTPRTPWMGDKLPSPDFSLSVKKFSDFMKPSPTKKRSSHNQSILRRPSSRSSILSKTSALPRLRRRVTFASLSGNEVNGSAESSQNGGSVYVEEDVSYLDPEGKKTTSVRVIRPTRPASPPPRDINSAEAGNIPDHDHKFAKHFEAMSKRKKDPRQRAPRLLPLDSPQVNSSQEVGAMAEAFIQASQTRRKGLELDAASAGSPVRALPEGRTTDGQTTPLRTVDTEEQENTAPVDDVSAVLDNLNEFLDNTWGVNLSMDEDQDTEPGVQHTMQTVPSQGLTSGSDNNGDPMWALNINIWAD